MRLIDADALYEKLNELGGCGADPETWADGWDKAIEAAITELEDSPTIVGVHFSVESSEQPMTDRELVRFRFNEKNIRKSTGVLARQIGMSRADFEAAVKRGMEEEF